ncbi:MAG TPA: DUF6787 family protein [Cytophagaceae bacterium]
MKRLKEKWGITSNWQIVIIFIVFGLTGITALQVKKVIFPYLGITEQTPYYTRVLIWMVTVFPSYYVFLLFYGAIFGQFRFFWGIVVKTFGRLAKPFKRKKLSKNESLIDN